MTASGRGCSDALAATDNYGYSPYGCGPPGPPSTIFLVWLTQAVFEKLLLPPHNFFECLVIIVILTAEHALLLMTTTFPLSIGENNTT